MSIKPGTRIGPYEMTSLLGEGGMGVVFRAPDTQLKRDVGLKLLPDHFANDPDRLVRFQREAQILASLNHPNIAQIHGLEESDNTRCIVMELVEGETLADKLKRGPMVVDEALSIAKQIAEALEYAHERGVVHRDLKPANIKVTPEGKVKDLDWNALPLKTPAPIRKLLRRCLEKTRGQRIDSAVAARLEIEEALEAPTSPAGTPSRAVQRLGWAAAAVVTLIAAIEGVSLLQPRTDVPAAPEVRLEISTPPTTDPLSFALSPDGRKIVFVSTFAGRPQLC